MREHKYFIGTINRGTCKVCFVPIGNHFISCHQCALQCLFITKLNPAESLAIKFDLLHISFFQNTLCVKNKM